LNSFWALEFGGTILLKVIWVSRPQLTDILTELIYKIGENAIVSILVGCSRRQVQDSVPVRPLKSFACGWSENIYMLHVKAIKFSWPSM
jgi:hypothetical protein